MLKFAVPHNQIYPSSTETTLPLLMFPDVGGRGVGGAGVGGRGVGGAGVGGRGVGVTGRGGGVAGTGGKIWVAEKSTYILCRL